MIEKQIHQIWFGPTELSQRHLEWCQSWKDKHQGWSYTLWRESNLPPIINRYLFDRVAALAPEPARYGIQSDILRYELLARYGGLYVDVDNECLSPVDSLLENQTFVAAMEPVFEDRVPNDFLACRAGHPVMWELVRELEGRARKLEVQFLRGESVDLLAIAGPKYLKDILDRTGRGEVSILPYQLIHPRRRWLEDLSHEYEGAAYVRNYLARESGMWRRDNVDAQHNLSAIQQERS
jgi:mannosyltransferase OCH1-like enzyme